MEIQVPVRFIPPELRSKRWYSIDDPTALALGDWIYDIRCAYAGYLCESHILSAPNRSCYVIHWVKSPENQFETFQIISDLVDPTRFAWIDPVMQDAGKCACGSNECSGDCNEC